jgi:hypothetical protein
MAFGITAKKKQTGTVKTGQSSDRYQAVNYAAPAPSPIAPAPLPTFGSAGTHDSAYDAAVGLAARNRDNELAAATGDADLLRRTYGYTGVDDFQIDPNNPFGRAQLLKRQYDQAKAGTQNSYAARGQQTSGAYGRMQNQNLFANQQANDALQKDYLQGRAQILARVNAANSTYGSDTINAGLGGLDRALSARDVYQTNQPAAKPASTDKLLSSTKRKDGKTVNRYASGRVAVF